MPVIQFVDEGIKRRIEKGFYGSEKEWNPQKEISLELLDDIPNLKELGFTFNQNPILSEKGLSTFIQDLVDPNHYICIKNYTEDCIQNKQKRVAEVLQDLGIHEYYIESKWETYARVGSTNERKIDTEVKETRGLFNGLFKKDNTSKTKISAEFHKTFYSINSFEGRQSISMEEWKRACENAKRYGLLNEIEDIINKRNPSKQNRFLYNENYYNIGGQINVNINLASTLSVLSCFNEVDSKMGLSTLFDFQAELKGEYKTRIVYNFDPDLNYEKYINAVDNYNKEIGCSI